MPRDSAAEYKAFIEEKNQEFAQLGEKYEPEHIPELAYRLFPFKWWKNTPYKFICIAFIIATVISLVLTQLTNIFFIFATIFGLLALAAALGAVSAKKREEQNHIFYSLIEYKKPLEENGWENLIRWYMKTPTGYMDDDGRLLVSQFFNRRKWIDPDVRHSATWQFTSITDSVEFAAIAYRNERGGRKVHIDAVDKELKPRLIALSDMFYSIIKTYSILVERKYVIDGLKAKIGKYKAIAAGAHEALDLDTELHAEKTWKSTEELLVEKQKLLQNLETKYQKQLDSYQKQIDEIETISAEAPKLASKIKEAKALGKLSWRGKDIEKLLDWQESLAELD